MRSVTTREVTPKKEVVAAVASKFVTVSVPTVEFVTVLVVTRRFEANTFVEVVLVPVALTHTKFVRLPFTPVRFPV
jgi:hypothetical protein